MKGLGRVILNLFRFNIGGDLIENLKLRIENIPSIANLVKKKIHDYYSEIKLKVNTKPKAPIISRSKAILNY